MTIKELATELGVTVEAIATFFIQQGQAVEMEEDFPLTEEQNEAAWANLIAELVENMPKNVK